MVSRHGRHRHVNPGSDERERAHRTGRDKKSDTEKPSVVKQEKAPNPFLNDTLVSPKTVVASFKYSHSTTLEFLKAMHPKAKNLGWGSAVFLETLSKEIERQKVESIEDCILSTSKCILFLESLVQEMKTEQERQRRLNNPTEEAKVVKIFGLGFYANISSFDNMISSLKRALHDDQRNLSLSSNRYVLKK